MNKIEEMYGFVEENSDDIFASDDHNFVSLFGMGRQCKRCGNYFMISGRDDPRWICPDCKKSWKRQFVSVSDDEGG